jgi:hypothetical protein
VLTSKIVSINTLELFNTNELELNVKESINWNVNVWDMFGTIQATLGLLKNLTNFNFLKFDQIVVKWSPTFKPMWNPLFRVTVWQENRLNWTQENNCSNSTST